jgi:hypothetical protein
MPRSEKDLAEALAQSEAWMDGVNPDEVPDDAIDDRKDLRQIGAALIAIEAAEQALVSAVANARVNKRSWTDIANILGVSRQAARQRFDDRLAESLHDTWVYAFAFSEPESGGDHSAELAICINRAKFASAVYKRLLGTHLLGTPLPDDELNELANLVKAAQEERKRD